MFSAAIFCLGLHLHLPLEAAENPEQWSEMMPLPSALKSLLPNIETLRYRVGSHYHLRFYKYNPHPSHPKAAVYRSPGWQEIPLQAVRIKREALKDPDVELCWGSLLSGATRCLSYQDIQDQLLSREDIQKSDLLRLGRDLSYLYGMRIATEFMKVYVHYQDSPNGQFENDFVQLRDAKGVDSSNCLRTTIDPYCVDLRGQRDSLLNAKPMTHKGIGIFLLLGMDHDPKSSPRARAMYGLRERLKTLGFQSVILKTPHLASSSLAAQEIRKGLQRELPKVDSAILMGMSKAGHEMAQFFAGEYGRLNSEEQTKIRAVVGLGAVFRKSFVSDWLDEDRGLTRKFVNHVMVRNKLDVHRSLSQDVLGDFAKLNPLIDLSYISFVNAVVAPDTLRSFVRYSKVELMYPWILNDSDDLGPNDGAVEVGAALPPPEMQAKLANNVVLRILGNHYVSLGGKTLVDGKDLSFHEQTVKCGKETDQLRGLYVKIIHNSNNLLSL